MSQINVLLLENVHAVASKIFSSEQYNVQTISGSLDEEQLIAKLDGIHVLGIRSKTQLTKRVIDSPSAKSLIAIGCFCIGTNQVDVTHASSRGIAVFNSPYANSRSVAEMTIANIINLHRALPMRNMEMHTGNWNKLSRGCYEVRGKTLGIVGYGHIGSQLSVLAEAIGMQVNYHDILPVMPIGSAKAQSSLSKVLSCSDVVSLHVPQTPETENLIGEKEIRNMKSGAYLINASRGSVVDINELRKAIASGKLGGAAIDVFPSEPSKNGIDTFNCVLRGLPNVILSPHIGGSTEEAQMAIGEEVSKSVVSYLRTGCTTGCVSLPNLQIGHVNNQIVRIACIHRNVPGVIKQFNACLSNYNIERLYSEASGDIAYMVIDVSCAPDDKAVLQTYLENGLIDSGVISIRVV